MTDEERTRILQGAVQVLSDTTRLPVVYHRIAGAIVKRINISLEPATEPRFEAQMQRSRVGVAAQMSEVLFQDLAFSSLLAQYAPHLYDTATELFAAGQEHYEDLRQAGVNRGPHVS